MFITACMEETDSTDAQQKLFVFLLSSEKSIPLSSFLSFFVPVSGAGFPLMKKTRIHEWVLFWVQAFNGHRGGEKVGKLARI